MKTMEKGDLAFFYHSNIGKEIVGIMEIIKTAHPDPTDETGKFVQVDVKPVRALTRPVTLAEIKSNPSLKDMDLVRLSRLSVGKVTDREWAIICKLSEK
jgi:predicted RNA-binding protein with PUA-like domain